MPGSRRYFSRGLLAALLLAPAPASAQFRVIPQVGLYAAATELPSAGDAVSFGKRESSLAYGGALELGPGLRFTVLHATDSEVPVSGVGCSACARSTVTAATAALVIRPLPTLVFVQPLVLLGAGVKRYDFTREDLSDEGARAILSDANDITGHLGLGLELGLGVVRGRLELQDLVSRFDAPDVEASFQHDLFVTFGVVVGG
jgi:hypothetical protein